MKKNNDLKLEQGKRMLEMRIEKNINQRELSKLSGISVPYISRMENGKVNITLKTLKTMAKIFDCTIEYLENGNNNQFDVLEQNEKIEPLQNTLNPISNTTTSNHTMNDAKFDSIKREIYNKINDVLLLGDNEIIENISFVINQYNEFAFNRTMANDETLPFEKRQIFKSRCETYSDKIKESMLLL